MIFYNLEQVNQQILKEFMQKYEYFCVSLSAMVRREVKNIYVLARNEIKTPDDIWGVIHIDIGITHCLPFYKNENQEFEDCLLKILQLSGYNGTNKKVSCIDGEKTVTALLVKFFEQYNYRILSSTLYYLMTKEDDSCLPPPASLLSMGEEIVCCKQDHSEDLYDLQFHYLKEEVVPLGKAPSELYVRSNLKSILKNQKVFAIESDGKFVAKANTNAIGWNWVQIGGVYTDPLYRRNGYSLCLLSTICRRINKTGRKICLFVKKANLPALSLYEKLDFKKSCDFQITYFE